MSNIFLRIARHSNRQDSPIFNQECSWFRKSRNFIHGQNSSAIKPIAMEKSPKFYKSSKPKRSYVSTAQPMQSRLKRDFHMPELEKISAQAFSISQIQIPPNLIQAKSSDSAHNEHICEDGWW